MKNFILILTILLLVTFSACNDEKAPKNSTGSIPVNTAIGQKVRDPNHRPILSRGQYDYMMKFFIKKASQQEIDSAYNKFSVMYSQKNVANRVNVPAGNFLVGDTSGGGGDSFLKDNGYIGKVILTDRANKGTWPEFACEYIGISPLFHYRKLAVEIRLPFKYAIVRKSGTDKMVATTTEPKPTMTIVSAGSNIGKVDNSTNLATIIKGPDAFLLDFVSDCMEQRTSNKYNITNSFSISDGLVYIYLPGGEGRSFSRSNPPHPHFISSFTCVVHGDQREYR